MKIQTTARIKTIKINGQAREISKVELIDLEFSALDTGGSFKDQMLDFSFSLDPSAVDVNIGESYHIELTLQNPQKESTTAFSYEGNVAEGADGQLEFNGRLLEDQLDEQLIGFVVKLLRS